MTLRAVKDFFQALYVPQNCQNRGTVPAGRRFVTAEGAEGAEQPERPGFRDRKGPGGGGRRQAKRRQVRGCAEEGGSRGLGSTRARPEDGGSHPGARPRNHCGRGGRAPLGPGSGRARPTLFFSGLFLSSSSVRASECVSRRRAEARGFGPRGRRSGLPARTTQAGFFRFSKVESGAAATGFRAKAGRCYPALALVGCPWSLPSLSVAHWLPTAGHAWPPLSG